jgi:hypothetical protein
MVFPVPGWRNGRIRAVKARGLRTAVIALLAVEVLDELVFGAREAAWPLIRDDLGLSYTQVGLLVGVPAALGTLLEPPLESWATSGAATGSSRSAASSSLSSSSFSPQRRASGCCCSRSACCFRRQARSSACRRPR